jgi:hypothetical protein
MVFALSMPLIIGAAGLGVETSYDYVEQTRLQTAADAAAYAGALENLAAPSGGGVVQAARAGAVANGWSPAEGQIQVNTPPTSGAHIGPQATEVVLTRTVPRLFSAYFSREPVRLSARSVAVYQQASEACILALNKTKSESLEVQGSAQLGLSGCIAMANSVADDALSVWGSGRLTADCVASAGGVEDHGGLAVTKCPSPVTQAARARDPFANLAEPPTGPNRNPPNGGHGPYTLQPGRYAHGLTMNDRYTLEPGVYFVTGGDLKVNANAVVAGEGVTIYLDAGSQVQMNGNAQVNLSAPTSGPYAGILFFGDRDAAGGSNKLNGNLASNMTGNVYFPTQEVTYQGNFTGVNGCMHIVADTVVWTGNATVNVDCATKSMTAIPGVQSVRMVE